MTPGCSHSVGRRLSRKLALLTMIVFGGMFFAMWMSIGMLVAEKNVEELRARTAFIKDIIELEARAGGESRGAGAPARRCADARQHAAGAAPPRRPGLVPRSHQRHARDVEAHAQRGPSRSRCPTGWTCRPASRWTSPAMPAWATSGRGCWCR
jgi:hypothetical protein